MPPPIKVELVLHDPGWAALTRAEAQSLRLLIGDSLIDFHHIGSTAIPSILAKPILDLIPVVASLTAFDRFRGDLERAGYGWWGEYGLPGRRYCTRDDAGTGRRLVQLHVYEHGSKEIERHIAFRDHLRANSPVADAYEREKIRCMALHCGDSHAYADCKSDWVTVVEAEAARCRGA